MENILVHMKPYLPYAGAIGGFILALIIGTRYKIPDLTRRMVTLENKGAKNKDLDKAIDSFHTVCRFNQVSCQKEVEHKTSVLVEDFNTKLGVMHEKLNGIAVTNANLCARVDILIDERANGPLKN